MLKTNRVFEFECSHDYSNPTTLQREFYGKRKLTKRTDNHFVSLTVDTHYTELLIDCGSSNGTTISDKDSMSYTWHTDYFFIQTGKNVILAPNQVFNTMNTLRYFPDGNTNCYYLPLHPAGAKFLFRAQFVYGNYDGLSKPPSFRLEIDGNFWANVTTSMSQEPVYHELIYRLKEEKATVCLVRNSNDDVPFISSLEAVFLGDDKDKLMYNLMENGTALYLHSRIDYGSNNTIQ